MNAYDITKKLILKDMYDALNESVFCNRLPSVPVVFDYNMYDRTGMTRNAYYYEETGEIYMDSIDSTIYLSVPCNEKATEKEIANTLLHEMCHVAVLHIDQLGTHHEDPHGPTWHKWAAYASAARPDLGKITVTSSPRDVDWPYEFICNCRGETPYEHFVTKSHFRKPEGTRCTKCHYKYVLLPSV